MPNLNKFVLKIPTKKKKKQKESNNRRWITKAQSCIEN